MCRLYGFRASAPTKLECALVHAQNALMVQSRQDQEGGSHGHGWGVATYADHLPRVERQAWAAYHGEHFRRAAERVFSRTVLAHVRRATIGAPRLENTHPFADGAWAFVHNGTVPAFERIRPHLLGAMSFHQRARIEGETDSEHVFRLLMTLHDQAPARPLLETLREGVRRVLDWCDDAAPAEPVGLNVILTDGDRLVGTRIGRTLYFVERDGVHACDFCGLSHVYPDHEAGYRAVEVASEPITDEAWRIVSEGSVYEVTADLRLHVEPL